LITFQRFTVFRGATVRSSWDWLAQHFTVGMSSALNAFFLSQVNPQFLFVRNESSCIPQFSTRSAFFQRFRPDRFNAALASLQAEYQRLTTA
jgi:hypothetical protein